MEQPIISVDELWLRAKAMADAPPPYFPFWMLCWLIWRTLMGRPVPRVIPLRRGVTLRELRTLAESA